MSVHRAGLALAVTAVFVASGCAVRRAEVAVPVDLPASFATSGTEPLPDKWWYVLGDEELDRLIEEALAGNFTLKTAWDRLAQAEAVARIDSAALYPDIDATSSAASIAERFAGETSNRRDFTLGLAAGYEVDLWGRVRSRAEAAQVDVEATREDVVASAITLSAAVADTWYALAEARQEQRVLEQQIETNERVLDLVTFRFRQGRAEAADVFRQRQLVESTRGDLVLTRSTARSRELQLAVLVGRAPGSRLPFEHAHLVDLPPLPATGIPSDLVAARPDVRAAYLDVQAADLRVAEAIADRFPRISLTAAGTTGSDDVRDLFDNWMANVAANLVQPLVDGGRRRAEVDRTRAVLSQALHVYGQVVLDTLEEVEDALSREAHQTEFLESITKQLDIAQNVIDRTRDSYLKGQLDYLRVLDALTSRQQLERQHVLALRARIASRIELARALAGGWPMDAPELARVGGASDPGRRPATAPPRSAP